MRVRTGDAPRRCHWHPSVPPSWGHFPTQGDTHAASQVLPGLGEEGQGLLALLGQLVDCGVCQHGDGEVQLGFHQEESVGHLWAGAGWLQTLRSGGAGGKPPRGVGGGGPPSLASPLPTARWVSTSD